MLGIKARIPPDGARALNREGGADDEHDRQSDLHDQKGSSQARAPWSGRVVFQSGHQHGA